MSRLDGKVLLLITGAARGIGAAAAQAAITAGAKVMVADVLDEPGRCDRIRARRRRGVPPSRRHAGERLDPLRSRATQKRFGKLDGLVNNAGVFVAKNLEDASLADWQARCACVNLTGVFLGTKAGAAGAVRGRCRQRDGSTIVNVSSSPGSWDRRAIPCTR